VPKSKALTILAAGAWVTTASTAALEMAGIIPMTLFILAAIIAATLTHQAGLAKNGVQQCAAAFRDGVAFGEARQRERDREKANSDTVWLAPLQLHATGRAPIPDRQATDIKLPGQRPLN
jgi:hypothetical protein